jgi:hypothetical protein
MEANGMESAATEQKRRVIVILDKASLETVKTKGGEFQLLNCDDHKGIMRKHDRDPKEYRPDIVHQVNSAHKITLNLQPLAYLCLRSCWLCSTAL